MKADAYAMMLLARRDYTEQKIREALVKKGFDEPEIRRVLEQLSAGGIISDLRYARNYVELNSQKYGRRRLEFFLRQKGIAKNVIDEVFADAQDCGEASAIREIAAQRLRREIEKGADARDYKVRQRILAALMRRGFDFDAANDALEREIDAIKADYLLF